MPRDEGSPVRKGGEDVTCQPEVVGSGESWGYWCPDCGSGVEGIGDRTTARQAARQHIRQRVEDRRKVMER